MLPPVRQERHLFPRHAKQARTRLRRVRSTPIEHPTDGELEFPADKDTGAAELRRRERSEQVQCFPIGGDAAYEAGAEAVCFRWRGEYPAGRIELFRGTVQAFDERYDSPIERERQILLHHAIRAFAGDIELLDDGIHIHGPRRLTRQRLGKIPNDLPVRADMRMHRRNHRQRPHIRGRKPRMQRRNRNRLELGNDPEPTDKLGLLPSHRILPPVDVAQGVGKRIRMRRLRHPFNLEQQLGTQALDPALGVDHQRHDFRDLSAAFYRRVEWVLDVVSVLLDQLGDACEVVRGLETGVEGADVVGPEGRVWV